MADRVILHCDMNNFYASVECMLDMRLRGHAVAVGGDVENRHGIILAKNYEAKKYGIQTGEALWQARQKCPNLLIVHPHYEEYLKYSRLARQIYSEYTDKVEPYGMDECWLDVTGCVRHNGNGEKIANEIRERMKFELGLTISVGVSFNKIFAKLGSDLKKPDAVTVIPRESFRDKIWGLPASDLLGVGRATERVLTGYGIKTIGELAKAPPDLIERRLGKCGLMCIQYANGLDYSRVAHEDYEAPIKSIGHGLTARQDLENGAEVWNMMLSLSQDIGHKLRKYEKRAAGVQIFMRTQELLALEPKHIEKDGSVIHIEQALTMEGGTGVIGAPKSRDSYRDVLVPATVRKYAMILRDTEDQFIWQGYNTGRPVSPSHFRSLYKSTLEEIGMRYLPPHSCRHTYVSQMQALGVGIETIQSFVGHADTDMTVHYLHVQDTIRLDAIKRFDRAFGGKVPLRDVSSIA